MCRRRDLPIQNKSYATGRRGFLCKLLFSPLSLSLKKKNQQPQEQPGTQVPGKFSCATPVEMNTPFLSNKGTERRILLQGFWKVLLLQRKEWKVCKEDLCYFHGGLCRRTSRWITCVCVQTNQAGRRIYGSAQHSHIKAEHQAIREINLQSAWINNFHIIHTQQQQKSFLIYLQAIVAVGKNVLKCLVWKGGGRVGEEESYRKGKEGGGILELEKESLCYSVGRGKFQPTKEGMRN